MFQKRLMVFVSLLIMLSMVLAACTETVEVVKTVEVPGEDVVETVEVEVVETVEVEVVETVEVVQVVEVTPTPIPTTRTGAWVDQVVFVEQNDAAAAVQQLLAGEIDIYAYGVGDPELFRTVQEETALSYSNSFGSYTEMTYNVATFTDGRLNPWSNPKIREATNWLIDRNYVVQEIYGGLGIPKFFAITAAFPDYAKYADLFRQWEGFYAYNPEKAAEIITAEMEAMGATLVDGFWNFNGEQVVSILLIRTEDERTQIGDYFAQQIEDVAHLKVDRQYKTRTECSPLWVQSDPAEGLWSIYTGGWITTAIDRDQGDNFSFFYTPRDYPIPLWLAYTPTPEFDEVTLRLRNNDFTTLDERRELFSQVLPLSLQDSSRVWIVDQLSFSPQRANIAVAYDLAGGVAGSSVWPYTVRFSDQEGGVMRISQPGVLVDPWNPVAGSNWIYDMMPIRATMDWGSISDPYTGLAWPQRIESMDIVAKEGLPIGKALDWVTLSFEPEIAVPDDAWVDWDAVNQVFLTAGEVYTQPATALIKYTVTYPADLFQTVTWHDGSPLTLADFMMGMIMTFDLGKADSAIYDEAQAGTVEAFLAHFKGVKILSTDPLVIEGYDDIWYTDAELIGYTWWPNYAYGPGAWHNIAVGIKAETAGELAFSADKADAEGIEWMSYISGPSLEILKAKLDEAVAESFIPYAPTLGTYVTAEEAVARYANLTAWYEARNNFWIGTGPFYLYQVYPVEGTVTIQRNPDFPDLANRWSGFGAPKFPVVEIDGAGQVAAGEEGMFDVYVTYDEAPYPAAEISGVNYLVFDAAGALVASGPAELVADGQYAVKLSTDVTGAFTSGAYKLEVTAVSLLVSVPTFTSFEFIVP
ncbi:MAG: hypothetical protein JW726_14575 [Anaerolineales bacterium]|nr:hypothetical protein [Anaerolineales bacterium]